MNALAPEPQNQRAILAVLAEGVAIVDEQQSVQFANEAFRRLFRFESEPVGKNLPALLGEPVVEEIVRAAIDSRESHNGGISISLLGRSHHLSVSATPFRESPGEPHGAIVIFHDITRLYDLEQTRSDFVANVSHELRTPISILAGYIENLADNPVMPRKEQAEVFGIMEDHALRLKALLDDLLTLSCLESRSDVLDYADLDLRTFFRKLAKDWQPVLSGKDMAVALEIADDLPPVRVDRFRFEQVIHNLFDNAFKYSQIEGQIRVKAAIVDSSIEISVEDNGAGIPDHDLPHIFERFYRVDKGRSRKYGGTGLGLSIVKHIVALHGGTVRAESTLGMTTRIIISLPLAASG